MPWTPQNLTVEQKQQRREDAMKMLFSTESKYTAREVAKELGVSEAAISQWKAREASGTLSAIPKSGAPSKLSVAQRQTLKEMLQKSPQDHGYDRLGWTASLVSNLIEEKFAVQYNSNYVAALLNGLGMSVQRPKTRSQKRNEVAVAKWKSQTYPELKKNMQDTQLSSPTRRTRV
jgi:transposase